MHRDGSSKVLSQRLEDIRIEEHEVVAIPDTEAV
jgi:hypothetical protein